MHALEFYFFYIFDLFGILMMKHLFFENADVDCKGRVR